MPILLVEQATKSSISRALMAHLFTAFTHLTFFIKPNKIYLVMFLLVVVIVDMFIIDMGLPQIV